MRYLVLEGNRGHEDCSISDHQMSVLTFMQRIYVEYLKIPRNGWLTVLQAVVTHLRLMCVVA